MCACGYMNDEYIVPMCPHTKKHLPPPMRVNEEATITICKILMGL